MIVIPENTITLSVVGTTTKNTLKRSKVKTGWDDAEKALYIQFDDDEQRIWFQPPKPQTDKRVLIAKTKYTLSSNYEPLDVDWVDFFKCLRELHGCTIIDAFGLEVEDLDREIAMGKPLLYALLDNESS